MAAAGPLDFNGFLGQIATLGTVNTDGQGFIAANTNTIFHGTIGRWDNALTTGRGSRNLNGSATNFRGERANIKARSALNP